MAWHIACLIINALLFPFLATEFFQIFAQYLSELIKNMSEGMSGETLVLSQHISTFLRRHLFTRKRFA